MRIIIKVVLKIRQEKRRVKALINSRAEANYIKRRLAIEINAPEFKGSNTPLVLPDGRRIYSYADYIIIIATEDIQGDQREANTYLISCDIKLRNINIILGFL